jgi:Replication initiator protein A
MFPAGNIYAASPPLPYSCRYLALQMNRARIQKVNEQFDLFLPYIADLNFRDQREMMERPFFSLAKSKRAKPIDYHSPDGKLWVHVSANPDYGMATIWGADILIYCASMLADMARRGTNDIPRKLHLCPMICSALSVDRLQGVPMNYWAKP